VPLLLWRPYGFAGVGAGVLGHELLPRSISMIRFSGSTSTFVSFFPLNP